MGFARIVLTSGTRWSVASKNRGYLSCAFCQNSGNPAMTPPGRTSGVPVCLLGPICFGFLNFLLPILTERTTTISYCNPGGSYNRGIVDDAWKILIGAGAGFAAGLLGETVKFALTQRLRRRQVRRRTI